MKIQLLKLRWFVIGLVILGSMIPSNGKAQEDLCGGVFESVSLPLDQLGSREYLRMDGQATGFFGGLYPGGINARPPQHETAGQALAAQIQPLDAEGSLDEQNGRIVLVSIGMSNTNSEFDAFIRLAGDDPRISRKVHLLNGAVGGATAERWVDQNDLPWQELDRQMARYQVSPSQVQAAWIKLTLTGGGDFPDKAIELQNHLQTIVQHLKEKFPNLKIAFLSSRTRSYTYWRGLSPEPAAFETGFAVKWLIEQQIQGNAELNYDPARGEVKAPYLSWGPYLWIDGMTPNVNGQVWAPEDLTGDCTHPSVSGQEKVARMLMDFFTSDSLTRGWFLESADSPMAVEPSRTAPPDEQAGSTTQVLSATTADMIPIGTDVNPNTGLTITPTLSVSGSPDSGTKGPNFGLLFTAFALIVSGITAVLIYRLQKSRQ